MEHTIKAHLSIILEKSLKFTGVWLDDRLPFFTSKTFEVLTLLPFLSFIFAIPNSLKFPYFFNAKSVAYSSIPEKQNKIRRKYMSKNFVREKNNYQLLLESAFQPSKLQCS